MYRRHKRCLNRAGDVVWVRSTVSLLRDAEQRALAHRRRGRGHHRAPAPRGGRAGARGGRGVEPGQERLPLAHEPRAAHAAQRHARLRPAARDRPAPSADADAAARGSAQIQQAGWHLLEMINDVLDLSRIDSGNLRLQTATLDLAELVEATTALVASDAARARHPDQPGPRRRARRRSSATRPGSSRSSPTCSATPSSTTSTTAGSTSPAGWSTPDVIEISVTDTGMGMTPEQMEELFRPFNRLGRERTALQGTGIGLVISRRLAELMGGSIRRQERPGRGLVVHPQAAQGDRPGHRPLRRSTTSKPCRPTTTGGSSTTSRTTRPTSRSCAASWRSAPRCRWRSR